MSLKHYIISVTAQKHTAANQGIISNALLIAHDADVQGETPEQIAREHIIKEWPATEGYCNHQARATLLSKEALAGLGLEVIREQVCL